MLKRNASASLALAVAMAAGGGLMGVSAPASAVNIAHDGLGEAMIFPYYNTRDGWATYINITNTSDEGVVFKIRMREGHNSREVRDFNVALSPHDVWTAAITVDDGSYNITGENSNSGGARLITADNSCTAPALRSSSTNSSAPLGVPFTNIAYNGTVGNLVDSDADLLGIDRQREGYIEVFNMGQIDADAAAVDSNGDGTNNFTGANLLAAVTHSNVKGNAAVPSNCGAFRVMSNSANLANMSNLLTEPKNVLKGRAVLIKGKDGSAMGYDPVTLANFFSPDLADGVGGVDGDSNVDLYDEPGSLEPNLSNVDPAYAAYVNDASGQSEVAPAGAPATTYAEAVDAVSALLAHTTIIDDYNVAGNSSTQWVLTMPTKQFYVDKSADATNSTSQTPTGYFQEVGSVYTNGNSCVGVSYTVYDREEFTAVDANVDEPQFSPAPPESVITGPQLCKEVNILTFGAEQQTDAENSFASTLSQGIASSVLPADNGWVTLSFDGGDNGTDADSDGVLDYGLPVVGFRAEVRKRGSASANYAFANEHAYKRPTAAQLIPATLAPTQ